MNCKTELKSEWHCASTETHSPTKNQLISNYSMSSVPDIKLIRTDTTLDLSQKAEKGMPPLYERGRIYNMDFIISAIPVYGLNVFELRLLLLRSLYVFRIDCGGP